VNKIRTEAIMNELELLNKQMEILAKEARDLSDIKTGDYVEFYPNSKAQELGRSVKGIVGRTAHNIFWVYDLNKIKKHIDIDKNIATRIFCFKYDIGSYRKITEEN